MISRTTHPNYARNVNPTVDTVHGCNCHCRRCLSEAIEAACAQASRMYSAGMDTTNIDATVDQLIAEHAALA